MRAALELVAGAGAGSQAPSPSTAGWIFASWLSQNPVFEKHGIANSPQKMLPASGKFSDKGKDARRLSNWLGSPLALGAAFSLAKTTDWMRTS
jgi:hypothetical protein